MQTLTVGASISAKIDRVSRSTDTKHIRILLLRKKNNFGTSTATCHQSLGDMSDWSNTNLSKKDFQRFLLQSKLRQSTSKGNEFSARVSVSEISCPDFRKTLRKSLQMHCNVRSASDIKEISYMTYVLT